MFHFQNLKQKFGKFSYFGNYINSFQIINLAKHDIYPDFQKEIMKTFRTNLIINSGKLMINMKKFLCIYDFMINEIVANSEYTDWASNGRGGPLNAIKALKYFLITFQTE